MALPDTTVKLYQPDAMAGISRFTSGGVNGEMINILNACLVDGFNELSVASLIISNNVAEVTTATPHDFKMYGTAIRLGEVCLIGGSGIPELNTEFRISEVVSSTVFRFATEGIPDQAVAGTITVKRAPLGWSRPFQEGSFIACYLPAPEFNQRYLQVTDNGTFSNNQQVKFQGYCNMTSATSGTDPFPLNPAHAPRPYKGYGTTFGDYDWFILGDRGVFIMGINNHGNQAPWAAHVECCGFGDVGSYRDPDDYSVIISGRNTDSYGYPGNFTTMFDNQWSSSNVWAKPYNQIGGPSSFKVSWGGYGYPNVSYPFVVNNGIIISQIQILDSLGSVPRCRGFPGIYGASSQTSNQMAHGAVIENGLGPESMLIHLYYSTSSSLYSFFADLKGPWLRW